MKSQKILIQDFKKKHILVMGDSMLDRFIGGDIHRMSPEAPVPIVLKNKETITLGGTANVANNIASLGARVTLFGILGDDTAGHIIKKLVSSSKQIKSELVMSKYYVTTEKTRVLEKEKHLLRIDSEKVKSLRSVDVKKILIRYKKALQNVDSVILSDYTKGFFTEAFTKKLVSLANKENVRVIVDTKPSHIHFFKNVYCIKPNRNEAILMSTEKTIPNIARDISKKFSANILITLGKDGMYTFENGVGEKIQTKAKKVFDVVGAGDTVIAVLALVLSDKTTTLAVAADIANHAAGIVVGKVGTATLTTQELLDYMK